MKKNIILTALNAKYIHSTPAVYSLKAYAEQYANIDCVTVSIAEYTINQPIEMIIAELYFKKPDVIAFSCYIWNINAIMDIISELPKVLPDTDIWLGGPEVSFDAEKIIKDYPQIKGIMTGEGEETFAELLNCYQNHSGSNFESALRNVKGILLKDGFTGERALADINKLPFIYKNDTLVTFDNRIIYYESQRGCPFRCAYCLSSIDKTVRLRDIETVKKELEFFLENKVPQVKFIDRTFNCNREHALSIWKYIKENDNGVTNFHFEIAADLLDDGQLEIMKEMRPGLIQLEIGVQSTNENTLEAINRRMDIGKLKKNVEKIHSFKNIHQHLDLIAGLPFEDYESFSKSFNDVYNMKPNQLQLGFLKVLKGSPMEAQALEYGIVYGSKPPYEVLYTKWLGYDDILKLKGIEEMVELYYNSGQFSYTLPVLSKEFASPFKMYEALSEYYHKKGYFINSPARAYRYNALLDFACNISPNKRALYTQLLTFDMYLRENLKSRPAFSPENDIAGDALRRFFEREEAEHNYLILGYNGYKSAQLLKMTHIEKFGYPVWNDNPSDRMIPLDAPAYVLFDYKNRNALTHDATFFRICLF